MADVSLPNSSGKSNSSTKLYSLYNGTLSLNGAEIECHHLSNGIRVFVASSMVNILSGGVAKHRDFERTIARLPNGQALLDSVDKLKVEFNGNTLHGYPCEWFIDVCEAYVDAAWEGHLREDQMHYARTAKRLTKGLSKIGIISLVDNITGFEKYRQKQELLQKLNLFLRDERMADWEKMFPLEFFKQACTLLRLPFVPGRYPPVVGKFIDRFVYQEIDKDMNQAIKERSPHPRFGDNRHMYLSEFGRKVTDAHIAKLLVVMGQSASYDDFCMRFDAAFHRKPLQLAFN